MDQIIVEGLEIDCVIGVFEHEKLRTQTLSLDLWLCHDLRAAGEQDDLSLTLDYGTISERLRAFAASHQFELLETLADRFAHILINEFRVSSLKLHLRKFAAVPRAHSVGVMIEREA